MRKSQLLFIGLILGTALSVNASVLLPFSREDDAYNQLYQAAESGDAESQYQLALFYEKQKDTEYPIIVSWLYRAARQGVLEAQFALGYIYQYGKPGIPPDLLESEKWYEKAASRGDRQAIQALEVLRNQPAYKMLSPPSLEDRWSVQWIVKTAAFGDSQSQFDLGRLYAEGKKIQMDYGQAAIWYEKAAAQGHLEAMYSLANLYFEGLGIKKDIEKASFWYKHAAERDYIPAQRKLYEIYSQRDNPSDKIEAAVWLYVSLSYLFPGEADLTEVSPELKDFMSKMSEEEKEEALYRAYSFIDEKRIRSR